jgi:dTDP-4-amino-4,6-dideoxygalactose transaminase
MEMIEYARKGNIMNIKENYYIYQFKQLNELIEEQKSITEIYNQNSTSSVNKVRELATVHLPWQQWTGTSVWFDDVGISAFHSCVVDLWQSLSEWRPLLSECV